MRYSAAPLSAASGGEPVGRIGRLEVVIASGQPLFCDVFARLLGAEPSLKIVGQASNEKDLARVLRREKPRTLLFDHEALGPGGEGIILRLRRAAPATRILVVAARSGREQTGRVLRAGASGLVSKDLGFETLVRAIHAVGRGEVWADRMTTAQALEQLTARRPDRKSQLTAREQQVAECVGRGLRNKEIARWLKISQKTVKSHLNNIFRKLRLDSRVALGLLYQERAGQSKN